MTWAAVIALAGGSVDIGSAATAAVLNAIAGGNDFVAAYPSNGINDQAQSIFYVLEDSPIKTLADLKGKKFAHTSTVRPVSDPDPDSSTRSPHHTAFRAVRPTG